MTQKAQMRERQKQLRGAISMIERAELSARIAENVIRLPEYRRAGTVLCYASIGSEAVTWALLREMIRSGRSVALPAVRGRDMLALRLTDPGRVRPGPWNVMEPDTDEEIDPARLDLIIAPGLAFDARCNRLGYGAGYFDRFLAGSPAFRTGICFRAQLVDAVPTDEWDIPMDAVITESEIYRRGGTK